MHMYKYGSLDTFNAHVFAIGDDDAAIKKMTLEKHPHLQRLFDNLVLATKTLSPQEFWAAHRDALVATTLAKPKIAIPNVDYETDLAKTTSMHVSEAHMQQIFALEPKVKQAYDR